MPARCAPVSAGRALTARPGPLPSAAAPGSTGEERSGQSRRCEGTARPPVLLRLLPAPTAPSRRELLCPGSVCREPCPGAVRGPGCQRNSLSPLQTGRSGPYGSSSAPDMSVHICFSRAGRTFLGYLVSSLVAESLISVNLLIKLCVIAIEVGAFCACSSNQ